MSQHLVPAPGASRVVAAIDIGAESGRVVGVTFNGTALGYQEIFRFPNAAAMNQGHLRWDFRQLLPNVRAGLRQARSQLGALDAVGTDAWGLDYAYLGPDGALVDDPISYRDVRTAGVRAAVFRRLDPQQMFAVTGTQLMEFNSLFQLYAEHHAEPDRSAAARTLLMIPDAINHAMCGVAATEQSIASTTGMSIAGERGWAADLLAQLDLQSVPLPAMLSSGTVLGPAVGGLVDLPGTRVVATAGHDTASAVVATPLSGVEAGFVSSGTWSLVGVEADRVYLSDGAYGAGLSNEAGFCGTTRLLKNVMGLWLLQECRRQWAREGYSYDYSDLHWLAAQERGQIRCVVNPDDERFARPGDMPARIREFCGQHGQDVPQTHGAVVRCVVDSLAFRYRHVFEQIAGVTGAAIRSIQVTGGGSLNRELNQQTADACGVPVRAGVVEASAVGNALVQLVALGELHGLDQIREVLRKLPAPKVFEPRPRPELDEAYERYLTLERLTAA